MAYKTVDLRGKLPGSATSNIGSQQKTPGRFVLHYSGPDYQIYKDFRAGKVTLFDLISSEANGHMAPGRFDPGFTVNGIQYHVLIHEDTVYTLRNLDAKLWHCADGTGSNCFNYSALALRTVTTEGVKASPRTVQTLVEFVSDKLREQGISSRAQVVGHQERSATACPGLLMDQFVHPFRAGILNPGPPPAPPFVMKKYNFVHATPWGDKISGDIVTEINRRSDQVLAAEGVGSKAIAYAGRQSALHEPAGELVTVVAGEWEARQYLDDEGKQAIWNTPKVGMKNSDVWDGGDPDKMYACLREIYHREPSLENKGLMKWFAKEYDLGRTPPDPSPSTARDYYEIQGGAIFSQEKILEWGRRRNAAAPWTEMVPHIYRYAFQRNIGADFLCIQVALETAFGRYGGDSQPYNPAGIKLANATGDRPQDFEVPKTADEGARMLVNHWCAVLQKPSIGPPHGRYEVAKAVYVSRPTITRIDQLGGGNWAADPQYATKLLNFQKEIGPVPDTNGGGMPNKLMDNVRKITKYFLDLERAGTTYHWWYEGHPALGEGPPSHAVDKPAPKPQDVKKVFCAGLGNLGLRLIGKPVPKKPPYDGGTGAWGSAYSSKWKKFVLSECREGDIAFRPFNYGGIKDQGHWAYVGPNGVCIQSYANHGATLEPGVTSAVTMSQSHFSWGPEGGYIWRIPREAVWS